MKEYGIDGYQKDPCEGYRDPCSAFRLPKILPNESSNTALSKKHTFKSFFQKYSKNATIPFFHTLDILATFEFHPDSRGIDHSFLAELDLEFRGKFSGYSRADFSPVGVVAVLCFINQHCLDFNNYLHFVCACTVAEARLPNHFTIGQWNDQPSALFEWKDADEYHEEDHAAVAPIEWYEEVFAKSGYELILKQEWYDNEEHYDIIPSPTQGGNESSDNSNDNRDGDGTNDDEAGDGGGGGKKRSVDAAESGKKASKAARLAS